MSEQTPSPGPSRGEVADRVLGAVLTGLVVFQYVDMATGGRLRAGIRQLWSRASAELLDHAQPVQPSPAEISAMHAEAQTITRKAAEDA